MHPPASEMLDDWHSSEALAEEMVPMIGQLYRSSNVTTSIFGRSLVRSSAIDIVKAHRYARQVIGRELALDETVDLLRLLSTRQMKPCRLDLGRLAALRADSDAELVIGEWIDEQLGDVFSDAGSERDRPTDVVLYGFGRIGRLLTRILVDETGSATALRLRAIVLRPGGDGDVAKRASLLRRDSVHGPFRGTIRVDESEQQIIANGNPIQIIYASAPDEVDYTAYGIENAIVVDNTGIWRDRAGLSRHLDSSGVAKVLLTAPGKGDIKNVIYGINDDVIEPGDQVLSAASCTTNAIVPVLKVMHDRFEVVSGHLETVHAYTNDQNLTDNFHKKARRGRSAPLNLVITETGAATAVAKALPELAGRLTGNAIRVPTPNVSLAILNLDLAEPADADEIHSYLRALSVDSPYRDQIDFTTSEEIVSSDLVGSARAGIVDAKATIVNGHRCVLYVWYDNEAGYSHQVVRIVKELAGARYPQVPAPQ